MRGKNVLLSKYKYRIISVAILNTLAILTVQSSALIPVAAMEKVIDEYVPALNYKMIALSLFVFCGIPVCLSVLDTVFKYFITVMSRKISLNINMDCFERLIYQPLSFFNEIHSAELTQKCTQETNNYVNYYVFTIPNLIAGFILAGEVTALLCFQNVFLGLAQLLYLPFLIIPIKSAQKTIEKTAAEIMAGNAEYKREMQQAYHSVRMVKGYNLEETEIEKVRRFQQKTLKPFGKAAAVENFTGSFTTQILPWLFQGATFLFAVYLMMKNCFAVGALVAVTGYTVRLYSYFNTLIQVFIEKGRIRGETEALREYLSLNDEKNNQSGVPWSFKSDIVFRNVNFAYGGDKKILSDFCLKIEKGKWIGIEGPSGIGKTTVFDLLLKFYRPDSGEIFVDGIALEEINGASVRENISCMFQNPYILDCTVRENILLGNPDAGEDEFSYAADLCGLNSSLLDEEINRNAGESGEGLSGGECKRIALARAVLRGADVLLLDEPVSNIDEKSQEKIRNALIKLKSDKNITVISVSHQTDFHKYADEIIRLE